MTCDLALFQDFKISREHVVFEMFQEFSQTILRIWVFFFESRALPATPHFGGIRAGETARARAAIFIRRFLFASGIDFGGRVW